MLLLYNVEQLKLVKRTALSTARSKDFVYVRLIPHATLKYWNNVNTAIAGNIHDAARIRGSWIKGQQITLHVIGMIGELFMSIIHQGGSCQKTALIKICKSIYSTEGLRDLTFAFLEGAWNFKIVLRQSSFVRGCQCVIISLEGAVSSLVIGNAGITHHTPSISLVQDGLALTREGER